MTSLIDVIFLLLLFFMLTSTFTKFAEVELFAAEQGGSSAQQDVPPLFIRAAPDAFSLNALPVTLDTLPVSIAAQRSAKTGQIVLVSLDSETSAQRLTDLLITLRQISGLNISVLSTST